MISIARGIRDADGARLRTRYGVQPGVGPLTPSGAVNTGSDGEGASPDSQASLPSQDELSRIDYCGNVIYDRGERRLLTDEGYVTFAADGTPQYHFYLRDHLGNIRVVFDQAGTAEQVTHYYPFGGVMRESTNPGLQPYGECAAIRLVCLISKIYYICITNAIWVTLVAKSSTIAVLRPKESLLFRQKIWHRNISFVLLC